MKRHRGSSEKITQVRKGIDSLLSVTPSKSVCVKFSIKKTDGIQLRYTFGVDEWRSHIEGEDNTK